MGRDSRKEFEQEALKQTRTLPAEFLDFLRQNKKWWMLPILVVMMVFALLMVLSSSAVAPFIYTLF